MSEAEWQRVLSLFEDHERRIKKMEMALPVRAAKFWRESAHGTLGHLTACQAAWLPLLKMMEEGLIKGSVAIRPDSLYTKLDFKNEDWAIISKRFKKERAEWRRILKHVDVTHELKTPTRILTAQSLTKRLVDHEKRHLDDLVENTSKQ